MDYCLVDLPSLPLFLEVGISKTPSMIKFACALNKLLLKAIPISRYAFKAYSALREKEYSFAGFRSPKKKPMDRKRNSLSFRKFFLGAEHNYRN